MHPGVYEIAKKHCGTNPKWEISLPLLQKKYGSSAPVQEFRRMLKSLVENNHLPDYSVEMETDNIIFRTKRSIKACMNDADKYAVADFPYRLKLDTYEEAKKAAPKWGIYVLREQWIEFWVRNGKKELKSPDAAFIGFCKMKHKKQPQP